MKTFKRYFIIIVSIVTMIGFTSCQSEDEMEEIILEGYCWEGRVPIRSYNNYYSRFYFDDNRTGIEEVWINGRYDRTYKFRWGWLDDSYGVLTLDYGRSDYSLIDISGGINNRYLNGYFYEDINDYYRYLDTNIDPNRYNRRIQLTSSHQVRYH